MVLEIKSNFGYDKKYKRKGLGMERVFGNPYKEDNVDKGGFREMSGGQTVKPLHNIHNASH